MSPSATKLWDKNFTIITLGTVISMLGNAISGFAIGLLVLDYTNSVFLYAVYMVVYNLPKIVMPMIAGPYLDNFSRRKVIYTLDFLSAGIYFLMFICLSFELFHFVVFLFVSFLIGSIDSIYQVAYDSLYPTLIHRSNYSKAYAISSMLYPLSAMMVPVAAWVYESVGIAPLFLFNAITFLTAAISETFIKTDESALTKRHDKEFSLRLYWQEFKDGVSYIKGEKGLMVITAYFVVTMFASASTSTLVLPYFKSTESLGTVAYTYVMVAALVGRLIGGFLHYRISLPSKRKYTIAICVYATVTLIEGLYLFTSLPIMMALLFINGFLAVNSFNIRISATQSYVPDDHRGRFNGAFQMLCNFGAIIGQLIAGSLGEALSPRLIILLFMSINFVAVFAVMLRGRKHVKRIYNAEPHQMEA